MAESRVFVARVAEEPFMEVSSDGAFINPITASFPLKDTRKILTNSQKFYVVVKNRLLTYVQLFIRGELSGASLKVSWTENISDFTTNIEKEVSIDATNSIYTIPFYVRFEVNDNMSVLSLDQYRNNLNIRLVYL